MISEINKKGLLLQLLNKGSETVKLNKKIIWHKCLKNYRQILINMRIKSMYWNHEVAMSDDKPILMRME